MVWCVVPRLWVPSSTTLPRPDMEMSLVTWASYRLLVSNISPVACKLLVSNISPSCSAVVRLLTKRHSYVRATPTAKEECVCCQILKVMLQLESQNLARKIGKLWRASIWSHTQCLSGVRPVDSRSDTCFIWGRWRDNASIILLETKRLHLAGFQQGIGDAVNSGTPP
jgi:hypothetical protein